MAGDHSWFRLSYDSREEPPSLRSLQGERGTANTGEVHARPPESRLSLTPLAICRIVSARFAN